MSGKKTRRRPAAKAGGGDSIAASFDYMGHRISLPYGLSTPLRRRKMIEFQKFRNNYALMDLRTVAAVCCYMAGRNWFLKPVLGLRHGSTMDGFSAFNAEGNKMPEDSYDFAALADDIAWADLRTSNAIAIWRKGTPGVPDISIVSAECADYHVIGGLEILKLTFPTPIRRGCVSQVVRDELTERLGSKMAKVQIDGGCIEIVKSLDDEWDFEVMASEAPRGELARPAIESVLDPLDFLDLMNVGDWNLAWSRKDVIRQIKKGYKGTGGQGSLGGVDISSKNVKSLGEGFKKVSGNANIPMNHDVDVSYLTMAPENFDPKQVKSAIDRIMLFGGIEAAVLLGNFSQQDGAAPTLMRHARVNTWARRRRIGGFINRIFRNEEFSSVEGLSGSDMIFKWSDRTLYSIEDLLKRVTGTADGVASTTTRREWMDLDSETESTRLKAEHEDREGYAPSFEARQGLLAAMFADLAKAEAPASTADSADPGRPANSEAV